MTTRTDHPHYLLKKYQKNSQVEKKKKKKSIHEHERSQQDIAWKRKLLSTKIIIFNQKNC